MTTTTVETNINRKFTITSWGDGDHDLRVRNTHSNEQVFSVLDKEQSEKLALALLGEDATVITGLPKVTVGPATSWSPHASRSTVRAGDCAYYDDKNPEELLACAKELLAIHKFLVEKEAQRVQEAEEAIKAEKEAVAKRDKRRDELATEFWYDFATYANRSDAAQNVIDRIIELEAAQA